jgi:hypothetical protein
MRAHPSRRLLPTPLLLATLCGGLACPSGSEPEIIPYTTQDRQVDTGSPANALRPRMCVAGTTVHVVWQEDRSGGRNQVLYAAGRAGGAVWDEPRQLSTNPDGEATAENPEIACVGDQVFVVWEDDRDSEIGHRNVYFRASQDEGRTWEAEQLLSSDEDGDWDALEPRIAADRDPNGVDVRIYVTWYDNRFGAYDIYVQSGTNGYNWLVDEARIDTDPPGASYSAHPLLASDGLGGVYVVWEDSRDGTNAVFTNRSIDWGTNWLATDTRLDGVSDGADAFGLALTVDRDRTNPPVPAVYVAWHDGRNGPKDIYLNRSLDGGFSWAPEPTRIDNDAAGSANSFYPALNAVDDRVLVAWHDDRDIGFDIYVRSSDDGGASWLSERRVDTGIAGSAHSLDVKIARTGDRVAFAWSDYRAPIEVGADAQPDIYYRVSEDQAYQFGGDDLRVDDDPQSTAISEDVQLAIAGPSVHMVWVDYRLGNADLWYRAMPAFAQ